jgi:quercetin dioxygenase-like cupin family protein
MVIKLTIFFRYDAAHGPDMSGAYLFMPSGEAIDAHVSEQQPTIYVINGHVLSQVIIQFSNVKHSVIIRHTKGIFF